MWFTPRSMAVVTEVRQSFKALPRCTVNQIHAGAQAGLIGGINACGHVGRRMRAVEGFEHMWYGGLHTEGNTGEAAGCELIDVILVDRVRVGFGGDFGVGRDAQILRTASSMATRSRAARIVGVPPPKNTVETGGSAMP